MSRPGRRRRGTAALMLLLGAGGGFGAVIGSPSTPAAAASGSAGSPGSANPGSPSLPKTTAAMDQRYLADVTEADPALVTYEQAHGTVALRALLTDGLAFCVLVARRGPFDQALVNEAIGARSTESTTHLPLSVTTFNTLEAVALVVLCPSEQGLLPAGARSRIRRLGASLSEGSG